MSKIIQQQNFNAEFGYCLRSSSIFYIPGKQIRTKIVLSNYWFFKNNIEVFIICNWRDINGFLIKRENIEFFDNNVYIINVNQSFIGSCEIEAFSSKNLKIPYSAIMIVYECEKSISMVHSYGRVYSNIEVEDGKTISDGHEGCWILKDSKNIESYAVLHNGYESQAEQIISLKIKNHKEEIKNISIKCKLLNPYETLIIKPIDHFKELVNFLNDREGSCTMHFSLNKSFTRALLCWQTKDQSQLQVTHSNFDYSSHETDFIQSKEKKAYMIVPPLENKIIKTKVYADRAPGNYLIKVNNGEENKISSSLFSLQNSINDELIFSRADGLLPSRIVTGIEICSSISSNAIPCEMSLGVIHYLRPKKRFHWGLISFEFNSKIIITSYKNIYSKPKGSRLCIKLYFSNSSKIEEINLNWDEISNKGSCNISVKELFNEYANEKGYFYFSLFSNYGGFFVYTTLEKNDSITCEHSF